MKETILNTIKDMSADFLYYDRKEDEQLSIGELNKAVKDGIITVDEMVNEFRNQLESTFNK